MISLCKFHFPQNLIRSFIPSWSYGSRFLQHLPQLVSALHEIDNKTLANNLVTIVNQVLFTYVLDYHLPNQVQLQAQNIILDLTAASINTAGSPKSPLFLQRYSPAVFKYVDTLCFKGESLSVNASVAFIQWFALYISNINYFWPWTKWYLFLSFHYMKGRSRSVFDSFSLSSSYFSIHHGIVYNQW